MITSDRQLAVAHEQLARLQAALDAPQRTDIPAKFIEANQQKIKADMARIDSEIQEYESLKHLTVEEIQIDSIEDLLKAPIKYRLASHLTVDEFARQVELNVRNIQRYEAAEYQSVQLSILVDILKKLNLHVRGAFSKNRPLTKILNDI